MQRSENSCKDCCPRFQGTDKLRNRESLVDLAAIKTRNMVVELNIQQMEEAGRLGAALVTGQRLQVSGPASSVL